MKCKVLELLRSHREPVSGEEISAQLGVSRTAVWKHIKTLREEGYEIVSQPGKGYLLKGIPDLLLRGELAHFLAGSMFARSIQCHLTVGSTNDLAKAAADQGAPEGALVVAECQEQGKGRLGRQWFSPQGGGIYASVVLRPPLKPEQAPGFTLLAAVALAEAVQKVAGLTPGIKWPNDVLLAGKKFCGILTEMKAEMDRIYYLVIGTGINVNTDPQSFPESLRDTATSIKTEGGKAVSRIELLAVYLKNMETLYKVYLEQGLPPVIEKWKTWNVTLGQAVSLTSGGEVFQGRAVDIAGNGGLVVVGNDGEERIFQSGEVTLRTK
ncbi:MAG: biotin--[acetyl-CoA-carboxylase] ligase [Clostridia bacterium]|nr:biotin--[acetyl-CoA-carboxylase] ligase [Clostridia bacterium]